jgi:hypothetical protein
MFVDRAAIRSTRKKARPQRLLSDSNNSNMAHWANFLMRQDASEPISDIEIGHRSRPQPCWAKAALRSKLRILGFPKRGLRAPRNFCIANIANHGNSV